LWEFNFPLSRWEKIEAPGQPPDRYRHSSVVIDTYLIIFGGVSATKRRYNEVSCFDLIRKLWFTVDIGGSIPCSRSFHQAAAIEGAMYVFGGVTEGGKKLGDTYRLITPSFAPSFQVISGEPMEWIQLPANQQLFDARTGHVSFISGSTFFVFGGCGSDGKPSNKMYCLDLRTYIWQEVETYGDIPQPVTSAKAAVLGDSIFLYGGAGEKKGVSFNELYHFAVNGMIWHRIPPLPMDEIPESRVDHSLTLVGEHLYLFGGLRRKDLLNDCLAFSLQNRSWNVLKPVSSAVPCGRFGHTAVGIGSSKMVIFGGWDGKNLLNDSWILDTMKGEWCQVPQSPNFPLPRYRHSAVVLMNEYMCIFGGVTDNQVRLNDVYLFNLTFQSWARVETTGSISPLPRTFHEACAYPEGDRMIIFGGRTGTRLKDVWTLGFEKDTVMRMFTRGNPQLEEEIESLRKRVTYLETRVICKVCMEKEINAVLIPCAHRCICLSCASVIVNRECICPICREKIVRLIETIDA
jgi:N-acetylneuraminic acid mutarotase